MLQNIFKMLQDISFCSHFLSNPHYEMQLRFCLNHFYLLHLDDRHDQVTNRPFRLPCLCTIVEYILTMIQKNKCNLMILNHLFHCYIHILSITSLLLKIIV